MRHLSTKWHRNTTLGHYPAFNKACLSHLLVNIWNFIIFYGKIWHLECYLLHLWLGEINHVHCGRFQSVFFKLFRNFTACFKIVWKITGMLSCDWTYHNKKPEICTFSRPKLEMLGVRLLVLNACGLQKNMQCRY